MLHSLLNWLIHPNAIPWPGSLFLSTTWYAENLWKRTHFAFRLASFEFPQPILIYFHLKRNTGTAAIWFTFNWQYRSNMQNCYDWHMTSCPAFEDSESVYAFCRNVGLLIGRERAKGVRKTFLQCRVARNLKLRHWAKGYNYDHRAIITRTSTPKWQSTVQVVEYRYNSRAGSTKWSYCVDS